MIGNVRSHPVGTRGGCEEGWGPCACPRGNRIRLGSVRPDGHTPTRTSTRPPHPPNPAPCPYRTVGTLASHCVRITPFGRQNSLGRGHASFPILVGKIHQDGT